MNRLASRDDHGNDHWEMLQGLLHLGPVLGLPTNSRPAQDADAGELRLRALRARLAELKLRYTEEHPTVQGLLAQIQELEARAKRAAEAPSTKP